jgi:hypothetical protein
MKIFKKAQVLCHYCHTWIPQQLLQLVPKSARPEQLSDGESPDKFSRFYRCPRCQSPIVRCPKEVSPK